MTTASQVQGEHSAEGWLSYVPSLHTGGGRAGTPQPVPEGTRWRTMAGQLLQPTFVAFPASAHDAPTSYSTGSAPCENSDSD